MIRWLFAYLAWLIETAGYWIRPYDMLADRRRWRWQPRQRCLGLAIGTATTWRDPPHPTYPDHKTSSALEH